MTARSDQQWLGIVAATSIDPTGLSLTTATQYAGADQGWRRTGKTLPAATASNLSPTTNGLSITYFAIGDTLSASACGVPVGSSQGGFVKTEKSAPLIAPGSASPSMIEAASRASPTRQHPEFPRAP
ncbi:MULTISPECIES: hypothetical protein [unclassified Rathayibacter]|uniref:hypothetical protein n=1 Tax=unclassified Rathayibacter TaxID=2609250 RepID=UPI00188B4A57|nr:MULTISPECIES: hypothetical protein [unclassified Rathayibacter]MBF4462662.1 hypothetical protein [Rathayibacter sp. VKM Ac-2879]MBF4504076.1 hypothetical protein [Rathayibacter sp. VKM Ac-2878]